MAMMSGVRPSRRHDGAEFQAGGLDLRRAQLAGKRLGMKACILQIRGDWCHYKCALGLQGWQTAAAESRMCFRCGARNGGAADFRDCSTSAGWRQTGWLLKRP